MSTATTEYSATGRRKNAISHVWMTEGPGEITINGRAFEDYFPTVQLQNKVLLTFQTVNLVNKFNLKLTAKGGGLQGQAGAIQLACARALIEHDPELRPTLKAAGFLRRDPRMKERKKYGQPGARARFQFSKR